MKDSFFEMLMNFFEKSLSQLKNANSSDDNIQEMTDLSDLTTLQNHTLILKSARNATIRLFMPEEIIRLTKASYQFLSRLILLDVISPEALELIINQLLFSESRFVTLQETKWTIRNTLAKDLTVAQLAFLDLVLYQKEDQFALH